MRFMLWIGIILPRLVDVWLTDCDIKEGEFKGIGRGGYSRKRYPPANPTSVRQLVLQRASLLHLQGR